MNKQRGFTLIELLMVLAIISILGAIGIPLLANNIRIAKNAEAQNTLKSIFLMQKNYYNDNYCYYVTSGTTDNTQLINQALMNSALPSQGPIIVGTKNDFYYYITPGPTGQSGSCAGTGAHDYIAYAKSRSKPSLVFSINHQNIKTGF